MDDRTQMTSFDSPSTGTLSSLAHRNVRRHLMTVAILLVSLLSTVGPPGAGASSISGLAYPTGTANSAETSGLGPPAADALAGYTQNYVNDFNTNSFPVGWDVFTGIPGGDPGAHFGARHVTVSGGLLRLNTWQDPAYKNGWVTGGLCQCNLSRVYGAYFVRSRVTGPGPNEVQLLWPITDKWPPEIDFNESGSGVGGTTSSVHFGASNSMEHRKVRINMMQWHTFGVVWTRTSIVYVVDGSAWASILTPSHIPRVRMRLDLEQRTMCALGRDCPVRPVSMLVDWIAEYIPTTP
jgi:hypothetical protein